MVHMGLVWARLGPYGFRLGSYGSLADLKIIFKFLHGYIGIYRDIVVQLVRFGSFWSIFEHIWMILDDSE